MAYDFYPQNEWDPSQTMREFFCHVLIPFYVYIYKSLFLQRLFDAKELKIISIVIIAMLYKNLIYTCTWVIFTAYYDRCEEKVYL